MAVRTASLRNHLMEEENFRKSIGRTLVKVITHGGACKLCTGWQGKVLIDDVYSGGKPDGKHILLSTAMKQGFLNPNCRHGLTTYYPELDDFEKEYEESDERLSEEDKKKVQYLDLNIKKYNREKNGFVDFDNKKEARKNYIECEKKKEEIIRINISQYKDYFKAIEKGYWDGNMKYCDDITEEWLGIKKKKVNKVIKHNNKETFRYKGKEYYIDGHDIVVEFKNGEEDFADILANLTDKRVELFPRFNEPDNFKSTDSKIGREYVDFKITTSGTDKFIYGNITDSDHQSNHYIFNIKNKNITKDVIYYQIDNVFRRLKYVKKIGIYHNGEFKMFSRKQKKKNLWRKMVATSSLCIHYIIKRYNVSIIGV